MKEIAPKVGDKFDSSTMNAVDTVVSEPENTVMKIHANGYKLHDRIIRPAMVQVSVKEDINKQDNKEASEKVDA